MHHNYNNGINIHDPAFDRDPKLKALKKQVFPAIAVFILGLASGIGGLMLAIRNPSIMSPLVTVAAIIFLGSCGYFIYVTVAIQVQYKRYYADTVKNAVAAATNPLASLQALNQASQQNRAGSLVTCPTCSAPASAENMVQSQGGMVVTCPNCRAVYRV